MTLSESITYFGQLLNSCFGFFKLEIFGIQIWQVLAAFILFGLLVNWFIRVFLNRGDEQ